MIYDESPEPQVSDEGPGVQYLSSGEGPSGPQLLRGTFLREGGGEQLPRVHVHPWTRTQRHTSTPGQHTGWTHCGSLQTSPSLAVFYRYRFSFLNFSISRYRVYTDTASSIVTSNS